MNDDEGWMSADKKPPCYVTVLMYPGQVSKIGIGFCDPDGTWTDIEGIPGERMPTPPRWWMRLPEPPVGG